MANKYEIGGVSNVTLLKNAMLNGLTMAHTDIETSPPISSQYGQYKTNVSHKNILVLPAVTSAVIMDEKTQKIKKFEWEHKGPIIISCDKSGKIHTKGGGDDRAVCRAIRNEFNKYDVIIAQNGDRFDFPTLQWRMMINHLPPIRNLITIDTLKLSKRSFRGIGHNLDAQASVLGYGHKDKQDMDDCILTMLGHQETAKARLAYNVKDVELMRKVFWRSLDYYDLHQATINMLLLMIRAKSPYCVKCAARRQKKFEVEAAIVTFKSGRREKRWQCKNCFHHWAIKLGDK